MREVAAIKLVTLPLPKGVVAVGPSDLLDPRRRGAEVVQASLEVAGFSSVETLARVAHEHGAPDPTEIGIGGVLANALQNVAAAAGSCADQWSRVVGCRR